MSFLNIAQNCSSKCEAWEEILDHYNDNVSDDEVWEIARESKELPIFGNVYQYLVLSRVLTHFCEETGLEEDQFKLFFYINSIDTHLVINDWDIASVKDFWGCIEKNKTIH
ncbi:TPA: hypothetical protein ACPO1V_001744 [Haemophilus influenzae]|uniref:hypothetical protein n=1 Tax=Haemophilus influenzae TaxID=727 RepID=UPI000D019427|nr:hypothetical protein [Haemophilus influenzae]PRJ71930.1 hypothetical protein BV115_00601 [Haemophilus influenzae]